MAAGVAQVITGVPCVAVPERGTDSGLLTALFVIVMLAERDPIAVGENVTLIVHVPPPATVAPQLFVWPKSPPFVPVMAMLVTLRVVPEVFVRMVPIEALVVPTARDANVKLVGEYVTVGTPPVPVPLKSML